MLKITSLSYDMSYDKLSQFVTFCHMDRVGQGGGHVSIKEAAKILAVSPRTIRRYIKSKKLSCFNKAISDGLVRIDKDSLINFLESRTGGVTTMTEGMTRGMTNTMTSVTKGVTETMTNLTEGMTKGGQVVIGGEDNLKNNNNSLSSLLAVLLSLVVFLFIVVGSLIIYIYGLQGQMDNCINLESNKIKYGRPPALTNY